LAEILFEFLEGLQRAASVFAIRAQTITGAVKLAARGVFQT
jgi:hypothetical protein